MAAPKPFRVGEWLVEPSLDRLTRGEDVRTVRPQVMELLVYLAERPREVVGTDTLLDDLWKGRIVTEGSIYNCVSELRNALATAENDDPALETIPKKGYRLVAEVVTDIEPEAAAPRRWLFAAGMAVVIIGAALAYWLVDDPARSDPISSIAILPLDNLSPDPTRDEYIASGMTELVIANLGRIPSLRVISRTTSEQVKARKMTIPEIASLLDVDAVIEGSVMTTEDAQLRVTLQLIDGRTDAHLWSRDYVRNTQDIMRLQQEVATSVTAELYARLANPDSRTEANPANSPATIDVNAYREYLKGRYSFNQFGEKNFRAALHYYGEAIALDPQFALAYAARAEVCAQPIVIMNRIRTVDDCYRDAVRATELDDTLAEGHAVLGMLQLLRWEWEEGGRSLDRAIEINPNSVMARQWRTMHYRVSYRFEEALGEIRYAEALDPMNLFIRTMVSWPLYDMHRFDEALRQLEEVLDIAPEFMLAQYNRGLVYIETRDADGVFSAAERVEAITGAQAFEARLLRASGHAITGNAERAREIIAGVEADGGAFLAAWIASIHLMLGDEDAALDRLERGLADRAVDLVSISEPKFDSVRQHPRFRAVAQQMGLPQIG